MSDTPGRRLASEAELQLQLLVLRCQAGDERAFVTLFNAYGGRTLAHLRGLLGDDAEDVQQDVWLTVFRSIRRLGDPGAFRTWLHRTTRHRAIDFLRRRKRNRELIDDVAVVTSDDMDVGNEVTLREMDESALHAALADLPPLQREAILLRYRDDLSYAEIALVVGCPLGTVRTRIHHGKRRLSELLKRGCQ